MVAGGDGTIKTSKKSKASADFPSKKPADSKKQKRRRGKGSKTRPRSKTKKISPPSRRTSLTSGEGLTDAELHHVKGNECDASCMVELEKLHQTCGTLRSEPTTCCIDPLDNATPPLGNKRNKNVCLNLARKEVEHELEEQQAQAKLCIERLSNERNYYKAEFERLLGFFKKIGRSDEDKDENSLYCEACQKKEQMIEYLHNENEILAKEKFCLMSRLQEGATRFNLDFNLESTSGHCHKTSCKRIERERDLLRLDIRRQEEETDCLREKIKILSENKTRDYARFQEQRTEFENVINKLEGERRELIKGQGIRRVNINTLEEKVDMYSNLLRVAQDEIQRVKTQYCQLKKLHDQCDKALLDTQAQLMEVETELLNCQNKNDPSRTRRYSKDRLVVPSKYPGIDIGTETDIITSKDIQEAIQLLNTDKDNLLNQLDDKTELLFQCQKDLENKADIISKLQKEVKYLEEKLSGMESDVIELKEKFNKSSMIIEEKDTVIKNLQSENEQKLMTMENCQTILEEKEAQNRVLQAEVEHLNKETHALASSNHQFQSEIQQYQVQLSVALETVNELENKTKQLEDSIVEYEYKIRLMKNDLEDFRRVKNRKEMEMNNLIQKNNSLQNHSEHLDVENKAHEKTICDLKCECQRLRNILRSLDFKEKMVSDLYSEMNELKAERDSLGKENFNLSKRVHKLENKLFQCICTICDSAEEKCSMANCVFKDHIDKTSQYETKFCETKEIGIQTLGETLVERNSVKQVMAAVPLMKEQSSQIITSTSTLPEPYENTHFPKKDAIISSMYRSVDPTVPFTYKHFSDMENKKDKKKIPWNIIAEERRTALFIDSVGKIGKNHDRERSSWCNCPDVEKKQNYIIDNATSVCEVIQVGTEDRIFRKTRLETTTSRSKESSEFSSESCKNI